MIRKFLTFLLFTISAVHLTDCTPQDATSALSPRAPAPITPPSRYYLKTKVLKNGDKKKDNLYLSTQHRSGGLNAAILTSDLDKAAKGFLNGTYQQFELNGGFPWALSMDNEEYAGWAEVGINGGLSDEGKGFQFSDTGLQRIGNGFGGWIGKLYPLRCIRWCRG